MNDQFLQGVLFDWNRIDNDSYLTKYNKNSPSSICELPEKLTLVYS